MEKRLMLIIKYFNLSVTTLIIYCNTLIYNYEISNLIGI